MVCEELENVTGEKSVATPAVKAKDEVESTRRGVAGSSQHSAHS